MNKTKKTVSMVVIGLVFLAISYFVISSESKPNIGNASDNIDFTNLIDSRGLMKTEYMQMIMAGTDYATNPLNLKPDQIDEVVRMKYNCDLNTSHAAEDESRRLANLPVEKQIVNDTGSKEYMNECYTEILHKIQQFRQMNAGK